MSEILVDTSAWVEFFHDPPSRWGEMVNLLLGEKRVCTTGLVMVELISGARDQTEFNRLKMDLEALPRLDPLPTLWEDMAKSRWRLKMRGLSGISIPDLIVAHVALAHDKTLLTLDRDFWRMRPVLGLRLMEMPSA